MMGFVVAVLGGRLHSQLLGAFNMRVSNVDNSIRSEVRFKRKELS